MNRDKLYTGESLFFFYGTQPVLEDLNFELRSGTFYGILGPNGCGKTTLIDILCGIRNPDRGTLLFKDKTLHSISRRDFAKQVALVPQEFDTGFGFSVEEIVLMGRHPYIDRFGSPSQQDWQAVENAMENIGISELRDHDIGRISGGQKQRAIVARGLAQESEVLLLDEATANLDIRYTLQIFDLARMQVSRQKRTVIAVMHDLNLAAAYCDELLILHQGKVHSMGDVESTLTSETIFSVYGVEAEITRHTTSQRPQINYHYGVTS